MQKFRRTPYRCRGCHNRFYAYIPPEKGEVDEPMDLEEVEAAAQEPEAQPDERHPDVAKPAE